MLLVPWLQLESLKKGDYVRKDKQDEKTLLANLYDPEDTKTGKSNKGREKERGRDKPTGMAVISLGSDQGETTYGHHLFVYTSNFLSRSNLVTNAAKNF